MRSESAWPCLGLPTLPFRNEWPTAQGAPATGRFAVKTGCSVHTGETNPCGCVVRGFRTLGAHGLAFWRRRRCVTQQDEAGPQAPLRVFLEKVVVSQEGRRSSTSMTLREARLLRGVPERRRLFGRTSDEGTGKKEFS